MAYGKKARGGSERRGASTKSYKVRRSQLLGPYGVGAVVPCPNDQSLMVAGLDAFPTGSMREVEDTRLSRYLGVSKILEPPSDDEHVPAVRFPGWLYCPACGRMTHLKPFDGGEPRCQNPECRGYNRQRMIPERFVVACQDGHISDFPIIEWVHGGDVANPDSHRMRRRTRGSAAGLGDIVYECLDCGDSRSLHGATNKGALEDVGFRCRGERPWLGPKASEACSCQEPPLVVQRGGTNVWYADVASSIYIPDGRDPRYSECLEKHRDKLEKLGGTPKLETYIEFLAEERGLDPDKLRQSYLESLAGDGGSMTEGDYRQQEFVTLGAAERSVPGVFDARAVDIAEYNSKYLGSLARKVVLVKTLRETRALVGFDRLLARDPDQAGGYAARRAKLSKGTLDWTIGAQSTGEGIFIQFDKAALEDWAERELPRQRFETMRASYIADQRARGRVPAEPNILYALIHTVSHLLMLSLSAECGYSAASVRERIYCDRLLREGDVHPDMLGVLVYTSSDDSEGSLGGLVRAGRPGRLEGIFDRAVDKACWCSSDPVCIESSGQGLGSCNLAACYNCCLVPETSCENANRMLDRALVVGTLEEPGVGIVGDVARG